jgi:hypothetical protein
MSGSLERENIFQQLSWKLSVEWLLLADRSSFILCACLIALGSHKSSACHIIAYTFP